MILENFQLDKCRGLEPMVLATSSEILVIKAPVAKVSKAMIKSNSKAQLHAEALGRVIQAKDRGVILFQLKGFDWTIVYQYRKGLRPNDLLPRLSDTMQTRTMILTVTDSAPYVYHQVWDNGESVEHIDFRDDHFVKLESQIRELSETCIDDSLLNDFYSQQGIYFPYLQITLEPIENDSSSSFIFKVGGEFSGCLRNQFKHMSSKERFKDYRLEQSDFEGFDYITFED